MKKLRKFVTRLLAKLVRVRPNRIVFSNFRGGGYGDSPKAICEVLRRSGEQLELLWLCNGEKEEKSLPEGVQAVPNRGWKRLRALASARVWVDNCRKYETKKKNQFYLQTWHGFPLKRIEADTLSALSEDYIAAAKADAAQCDLMVSGSGFLTKIFRSSFWYSGPVLNTGTPRNDVLYADRAPLYAKVCQALGLSGDRKLALYAPTYREDRSTGAYSLDPAVVLEGVKQTLNGEWTLLIRLHPNVAAQSKELFAYDGKTVVDATAYPDMMELLCAAELFISDYSSAMFDYALTGRPLIQYAPDVEAYKKDRAFYFPIDSLPFPLAQDNAELGERLRELQPLWTSAGWAAFARENEFCEDGQASIRCAALILQQIRKEKS